MRDSWDSSLGLTRLAVLRPVADLVILVSGKIATIAIKRHIQRHAFRLAKYDTEPISLYTALYDDGRFFADTGIMMKSFSAHLFLSAIVSE